MEDKRKHLDFEIVSDEKRFMKCVNNPSFKHSHIINENLVGVEKQKPKLKLDKPIFIAMSILDLSKIQYPINYIITYYVIYVVLFCLRLFCFGGEVGCLLLLCF